MSGSFAAGIDRSRELLFMIMDYGQEPTATTADWNNLHRAIEGLVELSKRDRR